MASLESLVIDLQVNSAAMRQGLDQANARLKGFEGQMKRMADSIRTVSQAAVVTIGAQAVAAVGRFVLKGSEAADQMGKLAQSVGVPVAELSRLSFAAKQSGVGTEQLGTAFRKLNTNLAQASAGSSKQVALFSAMGVSINDANGKLRGADAVLKDLATRFSQMQEGPAKAALAIELFGKEGARMLPLLNEGAEGIAKMEAEADRLGITLDAKAVAAATRFNDNLSAIRGAVDGVAARVAGNLAPALSELTDRLLKSQAGADLLKGAAVGLTAVFKALLTAGSVVGAVFEVVGKTLARIASIIADVFAGRFKEAGLAIVNFKKTFAEDLVSAATSAKTNIESIWTATGDAAEENGKKATKSAEEAFKKFEDGAKDGAERTKALEEAFKKATAGVKETLAEAEKLANLKLELDFETKVKTDEIQAQSAGRAQNFAAITAPPSFGDWFSKVTAGFEDFESALAEATRQAVRQAQLLADAKFQEQAGNMAAAIELRGLANEAGNAAAAASAAAGGFEGLAHEAKAAFDQAAADIRAAAEVMAQQMRTAIEGGVSKLNSMLGDAGAVVQSGLQGLASGGIWGAIIAIVLELLSKFERWTEVLDAAQGAFAELMNDLSSGLGGIVDGFLNLIDAVQPLADLIHGILNPILEIIGVLLTALGDTIGVLIVILEPILTLIGDALSGIAGLIKIVAEPIKAVGAVLKPILGLFGNLAKVLVPLAPLFEIIGFVLKIIALIILGIFYVIGKVINSIQDIFDANAPDAVDTGAIEDQINEITSSFGGAAKNIDDGGKKVSSAFDQAAKRLTGTGVGGTLTRDEWYERESAKFFTGQRAALPTEEEWKQYIIDSNPNRAMDQNEFAAFQQSNPGRFKDYQEYLESLPGYERPKKALEEFADSIERANEAMSNLPSGYKLALRRFEATQGVGGQADAMGRFIEMHGTVINVQATQGMSEDELMGVLQKGVEKAAFRKSGSRMGKSGKGGL